MKRGITNNPAILLVLLLFAPRLTVHAQVDKDSLAQKNTQKIEALMKDLDNLNKNEASADKGTDDCERQAELLSGQIEKLQEQLENNRKEVQRLTSLLSGNMLEGEEVSGGSAGNASISSKNVSMGRKTTSRMDNCYVVLVSFRKQAEAESWIRDHRDVSAAIMRNPMKTWFHVVMEPKVSEEEAGNIVFIKRKSGFRDSWWKEASYFSAL